MTTELKENPWELESGLPNDVDGTIVNERFGKNDKYTQNLTKKDDDTLGTQFIFDIASDEGDILGSAGYSVGSGWIVSEDGSEISHPKRKNVVRGTRYGDFQDRVITKLGVKMAEYGLPTKAATWHGLSFHWMQEKMSVVGSKERKVDVLLPDGFRGKKDIKVKESGETGSGSSSTAEIDPAVMTKLVEQVKSAKSAKDFQMKVMKNVQEVLGEEQIMGQILDEGPTGFYATHK